MNYDLTLDEQRLAGQLARSEEWLAIEREIMPMPLPQTKWERRSGLTLGRNYAGTFTVTGRRGLGKNPWWCGRPARKVP